MNYRQTSSFILPTRCNDSVRDWSLRLLYISLHFSSTDRCQAYQQLPLIVNKHGRETIVTQHYKKQQSSYSPVLEPQISLPTSHLQLTLAVRLITQKILCREIFTPFISVYWTTQYADGTILAPWGLQRLVSYD